jgi:type IV pilus assembly protein PilA
MNTPTRRTGFTLIEMLIVIAVIAVLALMAIPAFMDKVMRDQVKESTPLVEYAKSRVLVYHLKNAVMPIDNAQAELPLPDKIVNNVVQSVTVDGGAITVKFGNNAHAGLKDKLVTWRPMVPDDPKVPVTSWACHTKPAAAGTKLVGKNLTDIPAANLPVECRGPATAP